MEEAFRKNNLITGATGMIGSYLALAANKANQIGGYGINLILIGRNSDKAKLMCNEVECKFLLQDIREPLCIDEPIHYVLHTAGPVGPSVFADNPEDVISSNVEGTLSLLRYAIRHNCYSFVFASTHEVYGNTEGEQIESILSGVVDPINPRSCYVLAKQTAENALACYSSKYGLYTASARFSRLYGPLMNLNSGLFICDFIIDVLNNRPVKVKGELNLIRPLCYIRDAAEAMLYILVNKNMGDAYNVQGEEIITIGEIAELVSSFGSCGVEFARPETNNLERRGHWLNTDKLKKLGWQQHIMLSDGLYRTIDYFNKVEVGHENK